MPDLAPKFSRLSLGVDNNGNLTQKTSKSMGEVTTYAYDAEMRLTQASRPGMTAIYKYDPFGRRIEKSVNGTVTRYLYDREDIIARLDSNNQVVVAYSHGPETDEPLSTYQGGQWFFYHRDGLGSVTMMTDVSGTVAQSYNYGSFGNIIGVSNPNLIQPYTFTSREYDEETDLYYYRARYYDARAGRFISADPIGLEGGDFNYFRGVDTVGKPGPNRSHFFVSLGTVRRPSASVQTNLYRYTDNNPVNFIDPEGLQSKPVISPGFPRPTSVYSYLFPRAFCYGLALEIRNMENLNKQVEPLGCRVHNIDPKLYGWLAWCEQLGYLK